MGHRALVAYERGDGAYDLHYSHWGAAGDGLRRAIGPDAPFGGDDPAERVESAPTATGLALADAAAEHLDFQLYEAFYVVDREYRATKFLPLWFGLDDACRTVEGSETVGNGALVAVAGPDVEPADATAVRGWLRGAKGALGAMVDRRGLPAADATALIADLAGEQFRRREVMVVTPDGA